MNKAAKNSKSMSPQPKTRKLKPEQSSGPKEVSLSLLFFCSFPKILIIHRHQNLFQKIHYLQLMKRKIRKLKVILQELIWRRGVLLTFGLNFNPTSLLNLLSIKKVKETKRRRMNRLIKEIQRGNKNHQAIII